MTVLPKFEVLEDRIVLAGADPDVTFTTTNPDEVIELGEQDVAFTLTFDNTGTDSGYVPFAEIIIPTSGADGEGDGPTFDSAPFLGSPITTTEVVFDVNGEAEHPFLLDPDGDPLVISGTEGDTLVVLELPYGSFSPGNPAVDIDVVIDFSPEADLNANPTFGVVGGFALGCDELDNAYDEFGDPIDPPIREVMASTSVDPQLFQVTKANTAPESEASTGPNYVYQYVLTIDVAPGQTLTDFTLTDTLPPELVYVGNPVVISGPGVVDTISEPPVGQVTAPNNQLVVEFEEGSETVTVTFDYYIRNSPSTGGTTNSATTGADEDVINSVTGEGLWTPIDTDDAPVLVNDSATDTVTASTLSVQKSNERITDNQATNQATPEDIYEFT